MYHFEASSAGPSNSSCHTIFQAPVSQRFVPGVKVICPDACRKSRLRSITGIGVLYLFIPRGAGRNIGSFFLFDIINGPADGELLNVGIFFLYVYYAGAVLFTTQVADVAGVVFGRLLCAGLLSAVQVISCQSYFLLGFEDGLRVAVGASYGGLTSSPGPFSMDGEGVTFFCEMSISYKA